MKTYPERTLRRYDIESLPESDFELLEAIGLKRGCIVAGGRVDLEKVARLLINELRSGELGRICMEKPAEYAEEMQQVAETRARKAALKEARKTRRRK